MIPTNAWNQSDMIQDDSKDMSMNDNTMDIKNKAMQYDDDLCYITQTKNRR